MLFRSHGFFIAYVHIPPFICTLSGMLLWRGVALILLGGMTISPFPSTFMNIFNSYLPDLALEQATDELFEASEDAYYALVDKNAQITLIVTLIIAVICCFVTVASAVYSRASKKRKGYSVSSAGKNTQKHTSCKNYNPGVLVYKVCNIFRCKKRSFSESNNQSLKKQHDCQKNKNHRVALKHFL